MATLLITAQMPEAAARQLADKLMDGEHHLPISAAGAYENAPPHWRFEAWSVKSIDKSDFKMTAERFLGGHAMPNFVYKNVDDTDWIAKSLEDLPPIRAGRFVIYGSHDRDKGRVNEIRVEIEASLAFGTGHHPTTLGCLLELEQWVKRQSADGLRHLPASRPVLLDVGTGTGILALAAAKALPIKAIASDLDPQAIRVAKEHAKSAGLTHKVQLIAARGTQHTLIQNHAPYPLVIANILANPLVAMAGDFAKVTAPGGTIILSGLLNWQARRVTAAYLANGFSLVKKRNIGDWTTLVLKRKNLACKKTAIKKQKIKSRP